MPGPSLVQSNVVGGNNFSSTNTSTFSGAQTAGNTNIVVFAAAAGGLISPTISDSAGNVYTLLQSLTDADSVGLFLAVYVCVGIKAYAAGNVVTIGSIPGGSGGGQALNVYEWSAVTGIYGSAQATGTGTNPVINVTTTHVNDVVLAMLFTNAFNVTSGTGWTGAGTLNADEGEVEYAQFATPGTQTPQWGGGASSNVCVLVGLALTSAAAATAVTPVQNAIFFGAGV